MRGCGGLRLAVNYTVRLFCGPLFRHNRTESKKRVRWPVDTPENVIVDLGWRGLYRVWVGRERAKEVRGIVDSRGVYGAGGRRMGGRKLLFHLRLRQLGKTAALFAS